MAKGDSTSVSEEMWQQLANALGTSVPQAHQYAVNHGGTEWSNVHGLISGQGTAQGPWSDPSQEKLREAAQAYLGYSAKEWNALSAEDKAKGIQKFVNDPDGFVASPGTVKKVKEEVAAGKDPTGKSSAAEQKALEQEIANNPWAQIGAQLVAQDKAVEQQIDPVVAGQTGQAAVSQAANQALSALGGSADAGWLKSNLAAGQAQAAPLEAAMAQYGKAYQAGNTAVDNALTNYGAANAAAITTAPTQDWINALVSHIQSNAIYGGPLPPGVQLPPALANAYQQAGFTLPKTSSTGATSSGIPPNPVVTSGTPPNVTQGGNPNNPGGG